MAGALNVLLANVLVLFSSRAILLSVSCVHLIILCVFHCERNFLVTTRLPYTVQLASLV